MKKRKPQAGVCGHCGRAVPPGAGMNTFAADGSLISVRCFACAGIGNVARRRGNALARLLAEPRKERAPSKERDASKAREIATLEKRLAKI